MSTVIKRAMLNHTVGIEEFSEHLIGKNGIEKRIKSIVNELSERINSRKVTLVGLGSGSHLVLARIEELEKFLNFPYDTMVLNAKGNIASTRSDLLEELGGLQTTRWWKDRYQNSDFVLVAEVRHTGRSMAAVKDRFGELFPGAKVWTLSLIDRPKVLDGNCTHPLDFCGYRVDCPDSLRENRKVEPWLIGSGISLNGLYRGWPSIRLTWVARSSNRNESEDMFYKPTAREISAVQIFESNEGFALPERPGWGDRMPSHRS